MFGIETPIIVAFISLFGGVIVAVITTRSARKANAKVDEVVKKTANMTTIEEFDRVVKLLYQEIDRLNKDNGELRKDLQLEREEKLELLKEIGQLRGKLDDIERRIRSGQQVRPEDL